MEWSCIDHENVRFPDSKSSEIRVEAFPDIILDDKSIVCHGLVLKFL